jgi:hypothetical protein
MTQLIENIFAATTEIRYVATYLDGIHSSAQRSELDSASSSESDKYEELIVNPTLLKLVTQRGNIDCGGANWIMIRYGNFYELVIPVSSGHVSVGIELRGNPFHISDVVLNIIKEYFL